VVEALSTAPISGCGELVGRSLAGALVSYELEADPLAFRKVVHPRALSSADVDEHVVAAVFRLNEAKTLGSVKPLNSAYFHFSSLPRKRGRQAMSVASSQIIDVQKKTRLRVVATTNAQAKAFGRNSMRQIWAAIGSFSRSSLLEPASPIGLAFDKSPSRR
jgi:hypothetical protein